MVWEHIDEHANFRLGDAVVWLSGEGIAHGNITEMVYSPEGPVFWLSCAPFWVKPEAVQLSHAYYAARHYGEAA